MKRDKAQSILEYCIVIACIIASLVAMSIYVKRGIQGRLKTLSDSIGEPYSPKNTSSDITTNIESDTTSLIYRLPEIPPGCSVEDVNNNNPGCQPTAWFAFREERIDQNQNIRQGYEKVGALENDLFAQ